MFKPILHNLTADCIGFKEIQKYNHLIANKNLKGFTLKEKIASEKEWLQKCRNAFKTVVLTIPNFKFECGGN